MPSELDTVFCGAVLNQVVVLCLKVFFAYLRFCQKYLEIYICSAMRSSSGRFFFYPVALRRSAFHSEHIICAVYATWSPEHVRSPISLCSEIFNQ